MTRTRTRMITMTAECSDPSNPKFDVSKMKSNDLRQLITSSRDSAKAIHEVILIMEKYGMDARALRISQAHIVNNIRDKGFLGEFKKREHKE